MLESKFRRFAKASDGLTTLEFSLMACVTALGAGMLLVPMLDRASNPEIIRSASNGPIDMTVTGSVRSDPTVQAPQGLKVRYIFRSVLQDKDQPPCVAYTNGTNNGHC
ncbi:MAG: hypothetical protein AAFY73_03035 [Pseudomonadota bacterium]